jgi:hypothetical protein
MYTIKERDPEKGSYGEEKEYDSVPQILADLFDPEYPQNFANPTQEEQSAAFNIRCDIAEFTAPTWQEFIIGLALTNSNMTLDEFKKNNEKSYLFAPKNISLEFEDGKYEGSIPLVLLNVYYAPFTDYPKPEGNLAWVNVDDEFEFLKSLHNTTFLQVKQFPPSFENINAFGSDDSRDK